MNLIKVTACILKNYRNLDYKIAASLKGLAFFFDIYINDWKLGRDADNNMVVNEMIINKVGAVSNLYQSKQVGKYSTAQATRAGDDKVIFSNQMQSFSEMLGKLQNTQEVRQDKVTEFEKLIANGNYNVAAENIAASILTSRF